jgi:hypothetical protein
MEICSSTTRYTVVPDNILLFYIVEQRPMHKSRIFFNHFVYTTMMDHVYIVVRSYRCSSWLVAIVSGASLSAWLVPRLSGCVLRDLATTGGRFHGIGLVNRVYSIQVPRIHLDHHHTFICTPSLSDRCLPDLLSSKARNSHPLTSFST